MNKIFICIFMVSLFAFACALQPAGQAYAIDESMDCVCISEDSTIFKAENNKFLHNDTVYDVPIILYHHVKSEELGKKYSVTPEEFEEDLIFIKKHGFTTITVSQLIAFKAGCFKMPAKPVILTFDDGRYNNFTKVMPLLKKYNAKASFFIIGVYAERSSDGRIQGEGYSYMNFENLKEMKNSDFCDIQNHSYNLHETGRERFGIDKKKDESFEDYKRALMNDLSKNQRLLKKTCGTAPAAFAYPFGVYNEDAEKIIKSMGFSAVLKAEGGVNKISQDGDSFLSLNRVNRDHGISSELFFNKYFPWVI